MRKSGILMHISSLPSDYGIGTMGKEAYKFVERVQNKSVGRFCRLVRQVTAIRHISRSQRMQAIRIL